MNGTLWEWIRDGAQGAALALIPGAITMFFVGCTSPLQVPKTVNIATPVPCISEADKPSRPALMTDAELLALDSYRFTWALWGDRLERQGYEATLEAVVEGCSRIPEVKR